MNISVVIPTYNRKHTLPRAIASVLNQTLQPTEIIMVDDGSTDGTADWIQETYPRINPIRQSNKGVSAARNIGIKSAKCDWIALLDSDDEWLPDKLERQVEAFNQNPGIKLCHTEEIWIRNGVRVNQRKSIKNTVATFLRNVWICAEFLHPRPYSINLYWMMWAISMKHFLSVKIMIFGCALRPNIPFCFWMNRL